MRQHQQLSRLLESADQEANVKRDGADDETGYRRGQKHDATGREKGAKSRSDRNRN